MRIPSLLTSLVGLAGCFYVEPVNQRPALDIRPETSGPVYRNSAVRLNAIAADPEKHAVNFQWHVVRCGNAVEGDCDSESIHSGTDAQADFFVNAFRADPDGDGPVAPMPTEALRVTLDGEDDRGAAARPSQELLIPVLNHPPELEIRRVATHGSVIGTNFDLFAEYGDPDDTAANVTLAWTALSPTQMPATLTDIAAQPVNPANLAAGKRLVPGMLGAWDVRVVATDMAGDKVEKQFPITVVEDTPPCLDTWVPIAPTGGALYPLTEQTLFQIAVVRDDLDVYPPIPSDPVLGTTRFEWSFKLGAGPRQPLGTTSNSVAIDPASYTPGTTFELRVQIFDRKNVPITCADAAQTCAVVASNPDCIQRQTWHVEVR